MVNRKHLEQLNTSESWKSRLSVIAHIDLDAYFAQCLGIRINADPELPLGCLQWNTLIAVNYPSRKYGIKRGMTGTEAKKLCPSILLPHVATFKKGEQQWAFHEKPDPNLHKVSLDYFRRESHKIFNVFKQHFKVVQKAGVDECYVDLGPEVYRHLLETKPELFTSNLEEVDITHNDILDIGAKLVNNVRLEIHSKLKYTCSAGIAKNKMLAKLGSGFNKPFNQTVIYNTEINQFLSNFKFSSIGGWRGKAGKHVHEVIKIKDGEADECGFIRDNFTKQQLEQLFKNESDLANDVYTTVRGGTNHEVVSRVSVKSMAAVKNFKANSIQTWDDVSQWLKVYAADIGGRLADIDSDGTVFVPKTISVRTPTQSTQKQFEVKGLSNLELQDQIHSQSFKMCQGFLKLPCSYLSIDISNFIEIPKERMIFENFKSSSKQNEPLFVDDDLDLEKCFECGSMVNKAQIIEHRDWHLAKKIQQSERLKLKKKPAAKPLPAKKITDFFSTKK